MGDPSDFSSWYEGHYSRVESLLTVATGDPDVAADAAAEAFVRAYERWDRVRSLDSPVGWLYTVALNVARRKERRRALEQRVLRRVASGSPTAVDYGPPVWDAVRKLPPRQRTAIALRYVLDLPEAEVAEVMAVSRGSVSASLTAARRSLAGMLGPEDDEDGIGNDPRPAPRARRPPRPSRR